MTKKSFRTIFEIFVNETRDDILANFHNALLEQYIEDFEDILRYIEDRIQNEVEWIRKKVEKENPSMEFKYVLELIETQVLKPFIINGLKSKVPQTLFLVKKMSYRKMKEVVIELNDPYINQKLIFELLLSAENDT